MSNICVCGGRLGATGIGNCVIRFYTTHNYILVPLYDGDGEKNFIDISDPTTIGADVLARTQATTNPLSRLYPLPYAENITREKTDTTFETPPSGNMYRVQDGLRQNVMEFFDANASFAFARELKQFGCTKMGYYTVDINGTLEGIVDDNDPTKFYPFPMMQGSFDLMYMYATDTTVQKLRLQFNLQRSFDETQTYYLTSNDLGYPATELVGLIPATIVASSPTTTSVTVVVTESSNSALGGSPITGLGSANFTITNLDDDSNVVITGTTEGAEGTYVLTYSAVTGTHPFSVSMAGAGYEAPAVQYTDPT